MVVYDDSPQGGNGSVSAAAATLARVLQYLETPGHLRSVRRAARPRCSAVARHAGPFPMMNSPSSLLLPFLPFRSVLFPASVAYPELRAAEALCPTLHTPHHQRHQEEWQPYREGVVMRSEPGM